MEAAIALAGLLAVAALYAGGARRGRGARADVVRFAAGWLALAAALLPPLERLADSRFSAHMAQHEILVLVAAPLLVLGRPVPALLCLLPRRARRRAGRLAARVTASALVAWALHGVALWTWHAPALWETALAHPLVHALEHLTLTGTALLFWTALLRPIGRRASPGAAAGYVFATAIHTSALGALLTFSSRPWYATYAARGGGTLTPLEDQQLAGLIMWVPGGLILMGAALALVALMLRDSERRVARVARRPDAVRLAVALATLGVATAALAGCGARETATIVGDGNPGQGRLTIRKYGCQTCHTIPGVPGASAMIGPPLTRLASRAYVAGGSNTPDRLVQWIRHPQQMRPSTPMPDTGVTEGDARDIVAYLYTLR
jgi:putative membrane protein